MTRPRRGTRPGFGSGVWVGCSTTLLLALTAAAALSPVDEVRELRVVQADGTDRIVLAVGDDGRAGIEVRDPDGTVRLRMSAMPGGPSAVEVFDAEGRARSLLDTLQHDAQEAVEQDFDAARRVIEGKAGEFQRRIDELMRELGGGGDAVEDAGAEVRGEAVGPERLEMVPVSADDDLRVARAAKALEAWLAGRAPRGPDEARRLLDAWERKRAADDPEGGDGGVRWAPHLIEPSRDDPQRWGRRLPGLATVDAFTEQDWNDGAVREDGPRQLIQFVALDPAAGRFTGADLDPASVAVRADAAGRPCLAYRIRTERAPDYADWTGKLVGRQVAMLVDGVVVGAPRIMSRIEGAGTIAGNFTRRELEDLRRELVGGR